MAMLIPLSSLPFCFDLNGAGRTTQKHILWERPIKHNACMRDSATPLRAME